ncbi:hypothetical protein DFP73DRAFT_150691 [Morchella snyderi]|nr:hypothetical protein DFP73DRAFT_150691 [Morchella snyderi]
MPLIVPGINSKDGDSASNNMSTNPVIPNEEQIKAGVFDKKGGSAKACAEHHNATPGPVIPDDTSVFEDKPSREEQHAKAKELNKD